MRTRIPMKKLLFPCFLCLLTFSMHAQSSKPTMHWFNEPKKWTAHEGSLDVTVDPGTDYWQVTHYGFRRDNGPFYYQEQEGDFDAQVHITGHYRELFHQAGLMIRVDEKNWIK